MTYQIECGYCREVVTLPGDAIGRCTPCPACGGMLAVVSPVPTVPLAVPPEPDFPTLAPVRPWTVGANLNPGPLPAEWLAVRRGLLVARAAALLAMPPAVI